ncbi:C-type lectin protein [Paraphysoderma sedebokerense]|nr:C-type lectin protein [Paraphysoderma sedebokerense]
MRKIPTIVLYDEKGLQIFDQITYLEEYYLTNVEITLLKEYSEDIIKHLKPGGTVVELGSGSLRKTKLLLDAIESAEIPTTYYALDLMFGELKKSLDGLAGRYKHVQVKGLLGTYDDGMEFIKNLDDKLILWLGSSIGNYTREEATEFLNKLKNEGMRENDKILIAIDGRNDSKAVTLAYNDPHNVTAEFILNGLTHVNTILGKPIFDRSKFKYHAFYNSELGRHEAYYQSLEDQVIEYRSSPRGLKMPKIMHRASLKRDELIHVEYSYKYSPKEVESLLLETGFIKRERWSSKQKIYGFWLLEKPLKYFQPDNKIEMVPTLKEWEQLWRAWDSVTLDIVGKNNVMLQPIDLRHPIIFYIGHIPCFLDIQISRALGENLTTPDYYSTIFERGIDPIIEDPSCCHPHSEVPNQWPILDDILEYRDKVRNRVLSHYVDGYVNSRLSRNVLRAMWMAFEHESMHLETILYMLVQVDPSKINPPPKVPKPKYVMNTSPKSLDTSPIVSIPKITFKIGLDDLEDPNANGDSGIDTDSDSEKHSNKSKRPTNHFGWDNEKPEREVSVESFNLQTRPISIGEYVHFLDRNKNESKTASSSTTWDQSLIPPSWTSHSWSKYGYAIRTVFGPIPLENVLDHPVAVPQTLATLYAAAISTADRLYRLPTEDELRLFYNLVGNTDSANSDSRSISQYTSLPTCPTPNYSFESWTTTPLTNSHIHGLGNLWEWTSSIFSSYSGFQPSEMYPGYSADFFDGKHNVVLGASWATHYRIAKRSSFRNWYQPGYGYVFAGFRLVEMDRK